MRLRSLTRASRWSASCVRVRASGHQVNVSNSTVPALEDYRESQNQWEPSTSLSSADSNEALWGHWLPLSAQEPALSLLDQHHMGAVKNTDSRVTVTKNLIQLFPA